MSKIGFYIGGEKIGESEPCEIEYSQQKRSVKYYCRRGNKVFFKGIDFKVSAEITPDEIKMLKFGETYLIEAK